MKDAVLMDLDGTLLPMEQKEFIENYFGFLARRFVPLGFEKEALFKAVWSGTQAMVENDGAVLNSECFWAEFVRLLGSEILEYESEFEEFYKKDFDQVKRVLKKESAAGALVNYLNEHDYTTVLATNPLFPEEAVATRLSWIGLSMDDFDLVTTYNNSHYCKPNLDYYGEILEKIQKKPDQCMMVGNNVKEDMCAGQLGMDVYLVTEFLENEEAEDISCYQSGTLEQFIKELTAS